ncbi:MAG: dipeptidase, partial [Bacteroidota bacterium]
MKEFTKTLFIVVSVLLLISCGQNSKDKQAEYLKIHQNALTIDTHIDTPLNMMDDDFDIGKSNDNTEDRSCVDFPRMKEGGLDAAFFAVFLGQDKRDEEGHKSAKKRALKIFESIHESVEKNSDQAELALEPSDAKKIEDKGKQGVYIGLENGYPIANNLANIDTFYNLGARYITLCHTSNNDICDSSTDSDGPEHDGLSEFGEKVVKKMNEKGMIVDVSHISDQAFYDVIEQSDAPVVATHSNARALCESPRNLSDEMLKKLKENNGVIQISFLTDYIKEIEQNPKRDSAFTALREKYDGFQDLTEEERAKARKEWRAVSEKYPKKLATVEDMVDHIDYVAEKIGIDYVGIGTDFDGGARLKDCMDASQMPNVTKELVKRGYSEKEIQKIWGGNFLRVFREVKEV